MNQDEYADSVGAVADELIKEILARLSGLPAPAAIIATSYLGAYLAARLRDDEGLLASVWKEAAISGAAAGASEARNGAFFSELTVPAGARIN